MPVIQLSAHARPNDKRMFASVGPTRRPARGRAEPRPPESNTRFAWSESSLECCCFHRRTDVLHKEGRISLECPQAPWALAVGALRRPADEIRGCATDIHTSCFDRQRQFRRGRMGGQASANIAQGMFAVTTGEAGTKRSMAFVAPAALPKGLDPAGLLPDESVFRSPLTLCRRRRSTPRSSIHNSFSN